MRRRISLKTCSQISTQRRRHGVKIKKTSLQNRREVLNFQCRLVFQYGFGIKADACSRIRMNIIVHVISMQSDVQNRINVGVRIDKNVARHLAEIFQSVGVLFGHF